MSSSRQGTIRHMLMYGRECNTQWEGSDCTIADKIWRNVQNISPSKPTKTPLGAQRETKEEVMTRKGQGSGKAERRVFVAGQSPRISCYSLSLLCTAQRWMTKLEPWEALVRLCGVSNWKRTRSCFDGWEREIKTKKIEKKLLFLWRRQSMHERENAGIPMAYGGILWRAKSE